MSNVTGFHLPHNAIIPDEIKFIINLIDENKDYYIYDELKAMMFEEEIKQDVFQIYHSGMYKRFIENNKLLFYYNGIKQGTLKYSDIKNQPYSPKKTLNGCWNEQARDYFEFFAFTGLMPSYYKGKSIESEKRHYVGDTLKKYKEGKINYSDILFNMKFRNASKNSDNIEQYNVRNRPFVVILKVMNIFKNKGYKKIDANTLSYITRNIRDEDNIDLSLIKPIKRSNFSDKEYKEIQRGTLFFKKHLIEGLGLKIVEGIPLTFDLQEFNINNYTFKEKCIFIGDLFDDIEVTPLFLKCLAYPEKIEDNELKKHLIDLKLIDNKNSLYDFNIDTDLADRNLVKQYINSEEKINRLPISTRIEATELFKRGKQISESGNGTEYEEFLYELLKNKFGEDCITYMGANTIGERLSDIVWDIVMLNDDNTKTKLRIIIEAKSGGAITQFDERKEIDDIINTLNDNRIKTKYDGTWYMVVDSNKIPQVDNIHGGYREGGNKLSFKQKLLKIQSTIMPRTTKLTMVTAFSYVEFMKFIDSIDYNKEINYVSRIQAPDFWTWSNKFIGTSYVTIRA